MDEYAQKNMEFQEEYKRLDKMCRECYSSAEGVTEYIRMMENEQSYLRRYITSWEEDYKMLKHVRWVRNQLSHEIGAFYSNTCKQQDLDFVVSFYDKIMHCNDPLAQIRKLKEGTRKRQSQKHNVSASEYVQQESEAIKKDKKSIFVKFVEKIKKTFS